MLTKDFSSAIVPIYFGTLICIELIPLVTEGIKSFIINLPKIFSMKAFRDNVLYVSVNLYVKRYKRFHPNPSFQSFVKWTSCSKPKSPLAKIISTYGFRKVTLLINKVFNKQWSNNLVKSIPPMRDLS
jgi:hypothetical protein